MNSDGDESERSSEGDDPPIWLAADEADFAATDVEFPIADCAIRQHNEFWGRYAHAAKTAIDRGDMAAARVYSMLFVILSFRLKPDEPAEPFLRTYIDEHHRSAALQDFRGRPVSVLSEIYSKISNSYLRARVADVCWCVDKSRVKAGVAAVTSYTEMVGDAYRNGMTLESKESELSIFDGRDYLYRALSIGRSIGWEKNWNQPAKSLVITIQDDLKTRYHDGRLLTWYRLNLDFGISSFSEIAMEIEGIACRNLDMTPNMKNAFFKLAAQAYHYAREKDAEDRCRIAAAECLVALAEANESALFSSHWLQVAIAEYQGIPGTKERRRELRHSLIDVQAGVIDEMVSIGHTDDVSEIVKPVEEYFRGLGLMASLAGLACIAKVPTREKLEADAVEAVKKFPLSSLFGTTHVDHEGKVIHRSGAGGQMGVPNAGAMNDQIAQREHIRRSLDVVQIRAAREIIMGLHSISEDDLSILCTNSPFVPPGHDVAFARGFYCFFCNDMIGALSILVPQLENSMRYVLKGVGHDVTVSKREMTQEDRSLSSLFDQMRGELEGVFGRNLVDDLERVFLQRSGPRIRHDLAHGLLFDGAYFASDAIYACWLIFHLCCLPLLPHWAKLEAEHAEIFR